MNISVEEARAMVCPVNAQRHDVLCRTTRCPMWRWAETANRNELVVPADESPNGEPVTRTVPRQHRRGYCGLAGEPRFSA